MIWISISITKPPSVTASYHRVSLLLNCANKSSVEQKQKWAIQIHSFKHMTLFSFPNQKHLHIEHIAFGYLRESFERVMSRSQSAWHRCQTAEFEDSRRQTGCCKKLVIIKKKFILWHLLWNVNDWNQSHNCRSWFFYISPPYFWSILRFPWKKIG